MLRATRVSCRHTFCVIGGEVIRRGRDEHPVASYVWATTSTTVVSASRTPPTVNSATSRKLERRMRAAVERTLEVPLTEGADYEQADGKTGVTGTQHDVGPWSYVEKLGRQASHAK